MIGCFPTLSSGNVLLFENSGETKAKKSENNSCPDELWFMLPSTTTAGGEVLIFSNHDSRILALRFGDGVLPGLDGIDPMLEQF